MNDALYLIGFSPKLYHRNLTLAPEEAAQEVQHRSEGIDYFDANTLLLAELFGIERLEASSVIAWYKSVDRSDFIGTTGDRNLSDISWLTPRVMAHEEAVAQLSLQSSFYPARFGALFSSESSLHAYANSVSQELDAFFCMIRGKQEWGIKLYGNFAKAAQKRAEQSGLIRDGVPLKGVSYLKLKQLQRDLSQADYNIFEKAESVAIDSIKNKFAHVKERSITVSKSQDANEELLSNIAILEKIENASLVSDWVEKWNGDSSVNGGIRGELTGPWPVYSFSPALPAAKELDPNQRIQDGQRVA